MKRDVKYLNKDFASFRENLIDYAKTYFPKTYNDFNESDPGMMFIEMAAYVGDVLSYYIDEQFKETLLTYAEEKKSIYEIVQGYGYKPKQSTPSTVTLDLFQTVPSTDVGETKNPVNETYCVNIPAGAQVTSTSGVLFRTIDDCNFRDSSSLSPRQDTIFEVDDESNITKWLLKKEVKAVSGEVATEYIDFGPAEKYKRIVLQNQPVLEIISVTDSDGNKWHEVPFLAQDTVYDQLKNNSTNTPDLVSGRNFAPFILKLTKTSKRFKTFIRPEDDKMEMRFGSGIGAEADEEIIPNPNNVGSNLPGTPSFLDTSFDPANFMNTEVYGQVPQNTTLTIKYSYGGGVDHNVASDQINNITFNEFEFDPAATDETLMDNVRKSLAASNPKPASGGGGGENIEEIKTNALAYFQAQSRAVTKDDYITRVYSLPPKYGNVAKVYIIQDEQVASIDQLTGDPNYISNPLALNMYMIGYNQNKQLERLNDAVKHNIKTYLTQYRLMTDAIQIKDVWVCNIAIRYAILTRKGYNKNEVLLNVNVKLKEYFNIENWQVNQPIILSDVIAQILDVDGVATVVKPKEDRPEMVLVENRWGVASGYSDNIYDVESATYNNIVYPPVDPTIFEVKWPNKDIIGKVVGDI